MKKAALCILAAVMLGCTPAQPAEDPVPGPADNGDENTMIEGVNMELDQEYCNVILRWEIPSGGHLIAAVEVQKPDGTVLASESVRGEYLNANELLGYGCQSNDYYGPVVFAVKIKEWDTDEVRAEYRTEEINAADWTAVQEELDVKGKQLKTFSWSRRSETSYIEDLKNELNNFSLYIHKDSTDFYASWYDSKGKQKEIEKELGADDLQKLLSYIEGGKPVRRQASDPEIEVLDGPSEEKMAAEYEGMTRLEKKWYEYSMDPSAKQELINAVFTYCSTGKWPA